MDDDYWGHIDRKNSFSGISHSLGCTFGISLINVDKKKVMFNISDDLDKHFNYENLLPRVIEISKSVPNEKFYFKYSYVVSFENNCYGCCYDKSCLLKDGAVIEKWH